ncbi:MAG: iron-containing alcohol dehydrogenase, partial [Acidobacteriota bacterium]
MSHATFSTDGQWAADLGGVHVEFAAGGLDRLGETARSLPNTPIDAGTRVLVVTDPGLVEAGHAERALVSLRAAGLEPAVFDGARENPTTDDVDHGVDAARAHGTELLVALGGGSAMDCCKGINFLLTQGGAMEDYWGVDKASQPMLPSLGVPTTGGTGSEAQRFALISRASDHRKMACGDRKARFRTVILDPDLLATVPRSVAAVTGLDAVSHAVEAFVTRRRNRIVISEGRGRHVRRRRDGRWRGVVTLTGVRRFTVFDRTVGR